MIFALSWRDPPPLNCLFLCIANTINKLWSVLLWTALQWTHFPSFHLLPMIRSPILLYQISPSFLVIGTPQQLSKINIEFVNVGGVQIKPVDSVRNLGSWFDKHMSMSVHVGKTCSKGFRGLYKIRQIRKFLSTIQRKLWYMLSWHHTWTIVMLCWLAYLSIKSSEFREFLMPLLD
jgi:hypothetical protein